jgi:protein involved in polysaccharide export with SLBB domain
VIRRLPDEPEPAVIQVSLNSAKLNGAENLRLAPGDVVSVEATALTSIVDTMTTVVRVTAGVGGNLLSF